LIIFFLFPSFLFLIFCLILGRVPPDYSEQEEDVRTLDIIYQSLIITITFVLAVIFLYYSRRLVSKMNKWSGFVAVIAGTIISSFLLRCIFFIIVLAVDFTSSIYMFIVLMITEVLMMFFLQLQLNYVYFKKLILGESTSWGGSVQSTKSGSNVSNASATSGIGES
jgi:hypothetical protein